MAGSQYMTVAGLLCQFIAAGILCLVFFQFARTAFEARSAANLLDASKGREASFEKLLHVAIALPLLMVGFAAQILGTITAGGLNWLGVLLLLGVALGFLFYGCLKSEILEALTAERAPKPAPARPALLPRPNESAMKAPEMAAKKTSEAAPVAPKAPAPMPIVQKTPEAMPVAQKAPQPAATAKTPERAPSNVEALKPVGDAIRAGLKPVAPPAPQNHTRDTKK